jgi:hypothetical protein
MNNTENNNINNNINNINNNINNINNDNSINMLIPQYQFYKLISELSNLKLENFKLKQDLNEHQIFIKKITDGYKLNEELNNKMIELKIANNKIKEKLNI